jgi:DNA-binding transcriptional LysR family regulator
MLKIHAMNSIASVDLNLLVAFDAILKDRNITLAARRIGLSQPAMSSALGRLRRTFGDALFVRTGNGMQPTPYAQLLAPPIQRACELIAGSLQIGAEFRPGTSTRAFSFYMTDIGEAVFLPRLIGALAAEAPGVKVRVLRIPARGAQEAMADGEVDIAIGLFPD